MNADLELLAEKYQIICEKDEILNTPLAKTINYVFDVELMDEGGDLYEMLAVEGYINMYIYARNPDVEVEVDDLYFTASNERKTEIDYPISKVEELTRDNHETTFTHDEFMKELKRQVNSGMYKTAWCNARMQSGSFTTPRNYTTHVEIEMEIRGDTLHIGASATKMTTNEIVNDVYMRWS